MLPTDSIRNLGEALRDAVRAHRSRTALIEVDRAREARRLTYGAFEEEAERVARVLARAGVGVGDRVAVVMTNQSRWLTGAAAVFWRGATLVPLDVKLTAPEVASLVVHARPKALLTEHAVWRTLGPALETAFADNPDAQPPGVGPLHALVAHVPDGASGVAATIDAVGGAGVMASRWEQDAPEVEAVPENEPSRDDVACIVYSSGTGGVPKGCMLTHGNYLAQAQGLGRLFPMAPGERFFSVLPTNHAIDFMTGFLMPLMFGATVVHQRSMRPEHLRYALQRYGITHMAVVPRILRAFEERLRERLDDLEPARASLVGGLLRLNEALTLGTPRPVVSRTLLGPLHAAFGGKLRYVFAGGAYVDPELARFFYRIGIPVVIGYGLTEACTVLTVNDLKPFRPDTVGRPVDGVELEVRDAGLDGVGEVWARGPTIMRGYLNAPELTAEAIVDGWLRTGDLGHVDPAGHLHLVGRARDMIVTEGGKNVYPEDVEALLGVIDGVEELAVFSDAALGLRSGLTGERLVAVVRPKHADDSSWRRDLAARNRALAAHKRLGGVVLWRDEFPRTASLKLKRSVLTELLSVSLVPGDVLAIEPSAAPSALPLAPETM